MQNLLNKPEIHTGGNTNYVKQ